MECTCASVERPREGEQWLCVCVCVNTRKPELRVLVSACLCECKGIGEVIVFECRELGNKGRKRGKKVAGHVGEERLGEGENYPGGLGPSLLASPLTCLLAEMVYNSKIFVSGS